jgi:two-component system sensor histidine kinase BaeS
VSLRVRLATAFALVALGTALAVALTSPTIVGRGFARIQADLAGGDAAGIGQGRGGMGQGAGQGQGGMGIHAAQIQQETTAAIIVVALAAAGVATIAGVVIATRLTRPLRSLEAAAAAVAQGDLGRRSGLAGRSDELGELGRSFDTMAAELEGSAAARSRFLQDAVHELRTPLAVIEATTSAVLDGIYESEPRHLETVRDQARSLSRIVDDLRTISLAEGGALPLRLESIGAGSALEDAGRAFEARAREAGLRLGVETSAVSDVRVRADADRLRQVLGALLDNALRHTPPGGTVTISGCAPGGAPAIPRGSPTAPNGSSNTAPADRTIRLEVRDTGPGFAHEDLPHVFERFYQADLSRDRATGTSGLGLAIVKALVEAMGGRVGAAQADGGGARVWIELPVAR